MSLRKAIRGLSISKTNKIIFSKSGAGNITPRISLPLTWVRTMGITQEDREVEVFFEDNKIIITKHNK